MPDETRYSLRPHKSSDMDWVVEAHREIPSSEFGFSQDFAQMVQGIVTEFVKSFDEKRERDCGDGRRACRLRLSGENVN